MKSVEIKRKLIEEINSSDNKELLEGLYNFLNLENKLLETYQLSNEQKLAVDEARDQIKKGEYLTNDEANQKIDQWLNE